MQSTCWPLADLFSDVIARLPSCLDLTALAKQHGALRRPRAVSDGATLLRLALARGPGGLSLRDTAGWATLMGIVPISNPGVKYRLDRSVAFLQAILEQQLACRSASGGLHWPGRSLQLADGTCISQPGGTGTDWRVHGVFDLGRGGFSHLELTDAQGAERLTRGAPVAGEVRIADRYFARTGVLHQFRQASADQADFIVRTGWNAFRLHQPSGAAFDLIGHLQTLPASSSTSEVQVQATVDRNTTLPLRLVILRKSPEAAETTRRKLAASASRKQKTLDPRSLVAAEFLVLATSLPTEGYPAAEVLAAYRLRWQIELAFKRLKSLLKIDQLPTHTAHASRSWLLSHLILALICDEVSQEVLDAFP